MLLEAYADWSVPSVVLHERLHTPALALRTSEFVRLFVDITREDDTDPVQRDFALTTAPLLLVIAPEGTVRRALEALPADPQVLVDFLEGRQLVAD